MAMTEDPFTIFNSSMDSFELDCGLDVFDSYEVGYGSALVDMKTELMYELVVPKEQNGDGDVMMDLPVIDEDCVFNNMSSSCDAFEGGIPATEVHVSSQEETTAVVSDIEDLSQFSEDDTRSLSSNSLLASDTSSETKTSSFCVHEEFLKKQMQIAFYNLEQSMKRSDSSRRQLIAMTKTNEVATPASALTPPPSTLSSTGKATTGTTSKSVKSKAQEQKSKPARKTSAKKSTTLQKKAQSKASVKAQPAKVTSSTCATLAQQKGAQQSAKPTKLSVALASQKLAQKHFKSQSKTAAIASATMAMGAVAQTSQ